MRIGSTEVDLMAKLTKLWDNRNTTILKQSWTLEYNAKRKRLEARGICVIEESYDLKFEMEPCPNE